MNKLEDAPQSQPLSIAKLNALAYAHGTDIHLAPGQEKSGWRFSLKVIPNFELRSELLRLAKTYW